MLDAIDQTMDDTLAGGTKGQAGALVQQFFKCNVRSCADQFDVKAIRLVERFATDESKHLKVNGYALQREGDMGCVSVQHAGILSI